MVVPRSLSARTALRLVPLAPALVALLALVAPAAVAQASPVVDNANLDLQRPLRLEDALPVAEDTVILETGLQFVDEHRDTNHVLMPFRAVWGAAPHLQLEAGTYVASDPHDLKGQSRPGDVQLGALSNFVQETKDRPALSGKATVNVPSGGDSNGFDFGVEGLVTKSFDRLSLHANAGLTFLAGEPDNDRTSRWDAVVGASHPVDWFEGTPTTFIADFYVAQSRQEHGDELVGVEVGTRHQLDSKTVLDVGLGHDIDGAPGERDNARITVGLSFGIGT